MFYWQNTVLLILKRTRKRKLTFTPISPWTACLTPEDSFCSGRQFIILHLLADLFQGTFPLQPMCSDSVRQTWKESWRVDRGSKRVRPQFIFSRKPPGSANKSEITGIQRKWSEWLDPSSFWNHVVKILTNTYCLNTFILYSNNLNCVPLFLLVVPEKSSLRFNSPHKLYASLNWNIHWTRSVFVSEKLLCMRKKNKHF